MLKKLGYLILLPFILLTLSCEKIDKFKGETQEGIQESIVINRDDYDNLINEDKSFVLFISSATCSSCKKFNDLLNTFIQDSSLVIYKIEYYLVEDEIDYGATPAIAIIKDGELYNTINAMDNGKYFKSTKNIKSFILRYVEI